MSVDSERSNVVLRSPGEFAAAVPALLGFHPKGSLVAVFLREGRILVTMRVDLPEDLEDFAGHATGVAFRVGADEVVVAVYCPRGHGALPHQEGVDALIDAFEDGGVVVKDALLINAGRYWSYACLSAQCCPPEGVPMPESHVLEAERVGAGMPAVASDRDAVIVRYQPRPDLAASPQLLAQAAAILQVPVVERARQCWDEVRMLAANPSVPGNAGALMRARLQVAMGDVRVRDFVMASIAASDAGVEALTDVVVQAALTAPVELRPRIAGAAAALLAGSDGSSIAVDCLLDLAGDESLADLVRISQQIPTPPTTLRAMFASAMPMVQQQLRRAGKEAIAE